MNRKFIKTLLKRCDYETEVRVKRVEKDLKIYYFVVVVVAI